MLKIVYITMKGTPMKRSSTNFLRSVVVLIGLVILSICLFVLPSIIAKETTGDFDYLPILVGLYFPTIPFFFALYQSLKLLNYIDKNRAFSYQSVAAFRYIKNCALIISGLFAAGLPYIFIVAQKDDAPGLVAIGLVIIFASLVITTFSAVLQRLVQSAVDIKSENDLTV